jgi:hypothetical protein
MTASVSSRECLWIFMSISKQGKIKPRKVERLPPTAAAARDEGPRLIPLEDRISEPSRLEHYLDLADAALGIRKPGQNAESKRITRNPK